MNLNMKVIAVPQFDIGVDMKLSFNSTKKLTKNEIADYLLDVIENGPDSEMWVDFIQSINVYSIKEY